MLLDCGFSACVALVQPRPLSLSQLLPHLHQKSTHTPPYTYKHQDKTNSDEQIGHSHHIHPSTDSQRHGCGSVGHQYQGQHEEEEPACNSLVSCHKTERKESSKQPPYESQWGTLGLLYKTVRAGRKTKFGVGRNCACSKGPKSITERCGQAGPCLRLLVSLPLPQRPLKLWCQTLKSAEGSTRFMLQM